MFEDPYCVMEQDREVDGEPRWQTIGMVDGIQILLVAHLMEDGDEELDETIHIISAQKGHCGMRGGDTEEGH